MIKAKMYQVSPTVEFLYSKPVDVNTRRMLSLNNKLNGNLWVNKAKSKGLALFLKDTHTGNNIDEQAKSMNIALDRKISQLTLEKIYANR